jgi:hypothetical protein
MSEESKLDWQNAKATVERVLTKCVDMWLKLDTEEDSEKRTQTLQQIRSGLAIANRYFRVLRLDPSVSRLEELQGKFNELLALLPDEVKAKLSKEGIEA